MKARLNERKTEDIVRTYFKKDPNFSQLVFEEQVSVIPKIDKLLKNASKKGTGRGKPEFIISLKDNKDLLIVVECKADVLKHESEKRDKYADYAVDGALLYSSFLSKEFDVLSLAVSGTDQDSIKVSYFIQRKEQVAERIFGNKLISIEDILAGLSQDEEKRKEKLEGLLDYSKKLNTQLHKLQIKEDRRSLLVSGILIALDNQDFYRSYAVIENQKRLAKILVDTIKEQLDDENLQGEKIESLTNNYEFIKTHPSLIKRKAKSDLKSLKELIDDIDENINGYARTYKYYDILGQFYIEFLRYSNSDKGLGIVLTPPHITEFFSDIVDIKPTDIVYDNCTGTGGFLVSAMKKMIDKAEGDTQQIENIKERQLYGTEYQPEIYPLAVSNMFLHGDGKSNIFNGSCFDKEIIKEIKKKQPNIAFLNPPYKSDKKEDTEELEFILNALDCLRQNGQCVAIIPMSCVLAQKGERLKLKERLLEKHTLKAVFSMPNELFNNSKVGVVSCVIVIEAHVPHSKRKETFFGYFKDDGFYKRKTKGRFDYDKKWGGVKENWLDLYENNKVKADYSVVKRVVATDEWCAEAYMETDYFTLNIEDFEKTIKRYVAFEVMNGTS